MPKERTEADGRKGNIARRLFVDTADDNYIVARWCYLHSINVDFSWLAVHCLEKYLKAALVLNGYSAIGFNDKTGQWHRYGHDVCLLYQQVCIFAGDLLPAMLIAPNAVPSSMWMPESVEGYLARLYRNGNADSRYQLLGFAHHPGELFKLDAIVFAVRRVCIDLEAYLFNRQTRDEISRHNPSAHRAFSVRESLRRFSEKWGGAGGRLSDALDGRRGDEVRRAALLENFAFCRPDNEPEEIQLRSAANNSVLYDEIVRYFPDGSEEQKACARELGRWVLDNIQLPREIASELKQTIRE